MPLSRRRLLQLTGAGTLGSLATAHARAAEPPPPTETPKPIRELADATGGIEPISLAEHKARLVRAQALLVEHGLDALVVGPGTSLAYFTGARWGLSERFFGMLLTRTGEPAWVTPAFEQRRAAEQIQIGTDVRAWQEHESPFALVAGILKERGAATGRIGFEERLPFAFSDGVAKALPAASVASGTPVTAGCRMIKDAHEIAIMRRANEITVRAHRALFASLVEGMPHDRAVALSTEAHKRLGVEGGSLVLFGPDAAFPHGTTKPKSLERGDLVLIDGGCELHGYSSDISRTGVFGAPPTDRQRRIWELVRTAQDAAFRTVRRASSARRSTPRRARCSTPPASVPTTSTSPTVSVMASAWTATSTPTWCAATPPSSHPGCASPTSRGSTSRASWASATRTS